GAEVVLVNCVDVARIEPYVEALAESGGPFGVYANAGLVGEAAASASDERRAAVARAFERVAARAADLGASVVGACCGARPSHVRAIAEIALRAPSASAMLDRGA
ncbi:MAG: homocysteine S-methyltransferase family protein, partial [Myxococcales bacterium]|nr:homocysteine S-methyltransferase family protein [Myxococcales bacterium]